MNESSKIETEIRQLRTSMVRHLAYFLGKDDLSFKERRAVAVFIGHRSREDCNPLHFYTSDPDFKEWPNIINRMQTLLGPYSYALFKAILIKANVSVQETE